MQKTATIKNYLSLVKFSHTVFALPFALIGFLIAAQTVNYKFEWSLTLKVLLCMVFARTAAMAFNRYADRHIDALNPRTSSREIPSGVIGANMALLFVSVNCLAFIATTYFINPLCFLLSPLALLIVIGYSFTKRFTFLCHLILGLGLALAPTGAYLAVAGVFHLTPVLISLGVLCWVSGFDVIYSLQDEMFDRTNRLYSLPATFGARQALRLSRIMHVCSVVFFVTVGFWANLGYFYFTGCFLFAVLLLYQQMLVKENDLSKVNMAFFTTNGIASVCFAALVCTDLYL